MAYFITFLVFALITAGVFFKYDSEVSSLKKQLILVNKQNKLLKGKLNAHIERIKDFEMKTTPPDANKGIVTKDTSMRISPLSKSMPINSLKANDIVKVLTEAEISNTKWFEVSITTSNNINNIGWVKNDHLTLVDNSFVDFDATFSSNS